MAIALSLRVAGIEFDDDERVEHIESAFPAVSFVRLNGSTIAEPHLECSPEKALHAAVDLMRRLGAYDNLEFVEVVPHLVNTSDIARLTTRLVMDP